MPKILSRIFLLSLMLALAACQTRTGPTSDQDLNSRLRSYEGVTRWGDLSQLYLFRKTEKGEVIDLPENLGNIQIMSYDRVGAPVEVEPGRWTQTVLVEYVLRDQQVVRLLRDTQIWIQDEETKIWYRQNPIPSFKP